MTFTVGLLGPQDCRSLARASGGPRPPSTIPQKAAGGPAPDRRPPSLQGRDSARGGRSVRHPRIERTSAPAHATSIAIDTTGIRTSSDPRVPPSRKEVSTPSLMTDAIRAPAPARHTTANRRICFRYSEVSAGGTRRVPMYTQPPTATTIASQNAKRSIERTMSPSLPPGPDAYSVATYHVRRAFIATNTAAIPQMVATPTPRACLASDTTASWAASASGSPNLSTARRSASGPPPAGSAATSSHR